MADKNIVKIKKADQRRRRVRSKIHGTPERPRLTVCKSLKNIYVQVIDDENRVTLASLASNSKAMRGVVEESDTRVAVAKKVGLKFAELAKAKGIETVVFDRNRFRFHGRIKAAADGAREGGLRF
jgi:large subunit ribosomal protein L18